MSVIYMIHNIKYDIRILESEIYWSDIHSQAQGCKGWSVQRARAAGSQITRLGGEQKRPC